MAFSINEFIANLNRGVVAKRTNFNAVIHPPTTLTTDLGRITDLTYRCMSAVLPGRSIFTADYHTYGPPQKIGYTAEHPSFELEFILDQDFKLKQLIQDWQDLCVNNYRTGDGSISEFMFDVGYYRDYVGTIEVHQYRDTGESFYTCKFLETWPVSTGNIVSSWNATDQIHSLSVQFAYRFFIDGRRTNSQTSN